MGVFHAKGWWPKTSCPPSKLCLPWVSKRGIRDVPGILPGCPGPLAVFKKFVQKNFVRIFRSLTTSQKKYRNTPPICTAIRVQVVLQYFRCPYALRSRDTGSTPPICIAVRLPLVLQYASHLYHSMFPKILVVVVTGIFPNKGGSRPFFPRRQ